MRTEAARIATVGGELAVSGHGAVRVAAGQTPREREELNLVVRKVLKNIVLSRDELETLSGESES